MKKQTKLVAVLSTAALLAVGASMSSFAAQGWQEENGTWVYYDKSGDKETEKWEKSGDNWFYLNEDGEMTTDAIVEYDDNYYYVNESGAMTTNKWVSIENEDAGEDNEPANHWYYFGANGKAFKSSSNASSASFKTINGKKYIFDEEGKMLYGWINPAGERETDDDAWRGDGTSGGLYYCGDENDGAQATGWRLLNIKDEAWENAVDKGLSSKNTFDDEEQERWFYFKSNGKKIVKKNGETINGKKYSFDVDGRMNAEWVNWDYVPTTSKASRSDANYISGFRYYGNPEDGARVTKGWFQVVPDSYVNEDDYNDDETNWYYADKDGKLVTGQMKNINGKKYAFDNSGVMLDGYRFIKLQSDNRTIIDIVKKGTDATPETPVESAEGSNDYKFDTTDGFKAHASSWENSGYSLYYFGSGDDGAMKTNKQTVSIDGDNHTFLFNKSGSSKGAGKTGLDNKKYYQSGMLMAADKDDKYAVLKINATGAKVNSIEFLTTDDFVSIVTKGLNNDATEKLVEDYNLTNVTKDTTTVKYRLVNTSGTVQTGKSKVKDGDDRCFTVKSNGEITRYFVED